MTNTQLITRQRWLNMAQSSALILGLLALAALSGWLIAGTLGLLMLIAGGALIMVSQRRIPTTWMLRSQGGRPLQPYELPYLQQLFNAVTRRAGLEHAPTLWLLPSPIPNAMAIGEGRGSAVALTTGLIERMTPRQIVGVLAHEVSHLRHGDTRIMHIASHAARFSAVIANATTLMLLITTPLVLIGQFQWPLINILLVMLVPMASTFMLMALSRTREFRADLEAAHLTGDPQGLALALAELERRPPRHWLDLLMPPRPVRDPRATWLQSHPPTRERIRRLNTMTTSTRPVTRSRHVQTPRPMRWRARPLVLL